MEPRQWHWVASDAQGKVLVASDIPGNLWVSLDAGSTWSATNSPGGQAWVSIAINRTPSVLDPTGANALQLVAVAFGGGMYRYSGGSWSPVTSTTAGVNLNPRDWESINLDPGGGIVAAVLNGPIYYSVGSTWATATAEGSTTPLVRGWRGLAGRSAAVSQDGEVWVSNTFGRTWVQRNVVIDGAAVVGQWYRVAASADGNTIAVAGRWDSGMYLSRDRGLTWSRANTPIGDYTAIAMSTDGRVIAATLTDGEHSPTRGSVQLSRDGGATFSAVAMPGTDTHWRAVALSSDATTMVVAAGTFGVAAGQLYTSTAR
jgi:hypothetical protein